MASSPKTSDVRRPLRSEIAHLLRRRQGLLGADALLLLARAEGLTDQELSRLVRTWEGRRWPRK